MRAGLLRQIARIEQPVAVSKGRANETIVKWTKYCDFFTEITSFQGKEFFDKGQRYSERIFVFRGRYFDLIGVSELMRVSYEKEFYNIKTVVPDSDRLQDVLIQTTLIK